MIWPADFLDRIVNGDALQVLKEIPDNSIHCCVTSPPYWGLRDYGTAEWKGGDSGHEHQGKDSRTVSGGAGKQYTNKGSNRVFSGDCECGARRVDNQLGLEKTPEEFVAKMVEVFREVRRVLRDDGTLWLNLGSSYASGDTQPNQSRDGVPACDSGGIGPRCSRETGCACSCHDDEHQDGSPCHDTGSISQQPSQSLQPRAQTTHDNEQQDSASASPPAFSRDAPKSTTRASWRRDRAAYVPGAKASVSRSRQSSFSVGGRLSSCRSCLNLTILSQKFKPKDLVPIPWMVAMALQADGWYLRSDIIWAKKNCMPESVTDRPTKSHEYIFLLTKSQEYFFDAEAIREDADPESAERYKYSFGGPKAQTLTEEEADGPGTRTHPIVVREFAGKRNKRSVWIVATHAYPECHFATFPPKLIEPCILAGTSEKGACAECGAPHVRILEKSKTGHEDYSGKWSTQDPQSSGRRILGRVNAARKAGGNHDNPFPPPKTVGWKPTCTCGAGVVPCTVLDPFGGAGTTTLVAAQYSRRSVSIELNPEYAKMARKRVATELAQGKFL